MPKPEKPVVAVGGLIESGDKVLLVKRGKAPGKGLWSIPGGVVKLGETLHDALKREILEEIGLKISVGRLIGVFEVIEKDDHGISFHYVIVDYLCNVESGKLKAGSDAADARWFNIAQIKDLKMTKTTKKILFQRYFEKNSLVIRNEDLEWILIGIPEGHTHIRTILNIKGLPYLILQQATVSGLIRGFLNVLLHPLKRGIKLQRASVSNQKSGYAKNQLLELNVSERKVLEEISKILSS